MSDKKIVVIGGGVIGASILYQLSLRGVKATIVERCKIACGASGKSGGFLALDWCDNSEQKHLARKSFVMHEELSNNLKKDIGYRKVDTISISFKAELPNKKTTDFPLPWLNNGKCTNTKIIGTPKNTAQVTPYLYTNAMVDAALEAGSTLKIGKAEGILVKDGAVCGVLVDGETIPADIAVVAMGPWSNSLQYIKVPTIESFKAHSIVLTPKEKVSAHAIFVEVRSALINKLPTSPEIYPRPNGEVYICGCANYDTKLPEDPSSIQPDPDATESLQKFATNISTGLDVPITTSQACFIPSTTDGLPIIGKLSEVEGAYVAAGHGVWGILNSPATGLAITELILDGESKSVNITAFDPNR